MGWMLKVKNEKSKLKSECELCFPLHFYLLRFHVLLSDWQYADFAAARAVVFVAHAPVDFREERVVFAQPDVQPRQEPPSALAHEDGPAGHDVAVVAFNAEPLRVAVTAVARTALAFFVCHDLFSVAPSYQLPAVASCRFLEPGSWQLYLNVRNAHARVDGAMAFRAPLALPALLLEDPDFRPARLAVDDAHHSGAGHKRRAGDELAAVLC